MVSQDISRPAHVSGGQNNSVNYVVYSDEWYIKYSVESDSNSFDVYLYIYSNVKVY